MKKLLFIILLVWVSSASATTVTSKPAVSGDDISWVLAISDCNLTYTTYYLGNDGDSNQTGIRFPTVNVPNGATITSATITFTANATDAGTTCNLQFKGEDTANAAIFIGCTTGASPYTARYRTTASVVWSSIGTWTSGNAYVSADLSTIVQEIVNRGDWSANNAMVFFVDAYTSTSGTGIRHAYSYDGSSTLCPTLTITYGTGGATATGRVNLGGPTGVGINGGPTGVGVR